jgi:hypothetical protein
MVNSTHGILEEALGVIGLRGGGDHDMVDNNIDHQEP